MRTLHDREIVRKLETMFVRKSRAGKGGCLTVGKHIGEGYGWTRCIRTIELEVTPPLEPELIDLIAGESRVPIRDEEPFMRSAVSVLGHAPIADSRGRIVAIGLCPVLPVEDGAQMVGLVQLVVELGEENILPQVTWKGAE